MNATIHVKPETQNERLDGMGLATPAETRGLMGNGPCLDPPESVVRVFGRVWNQTDPCLRSKPGPLAGQPDPLLTLVISSSYLWNFVRAADDVSHAENLQSTGCRWLSYLNEFRDEIQVT